MSPPDRARAFAPASVGNVAVGFDVLGYSASFTGDRVRAVRTAARGVRIAGITGVVVDLPLAVERNTAGMAVAAMAEALDLDFGFELTIEKGIPLGSGLGGSAASAVAAVVAANALLDRPLDNLRLLKFAMQGELVASGTAHIDNIAPSLYGGLVLCVGIDDPHIKQIPVPSTVRSVLVRPHRILETRGARAILGRTVALSDVVWQQANLAGVVADPFFQAGEGGVETGDDFGDIRSAGFHDFDFVGELAEWGGDTDAGHGISLVWMDLASGHSASVDGRILFFRRPTRRHSPRPCHRSVLQTPANSA